MKKKHIVLLSLAALIIIFCLWYTRPRSMESYCPPLEITECTEIKFNNRVYSGTTLEDGSYRPYNEFEEIVFVPGEPEFERLIELLDEGRFRTRLANILPKGTRTHSAQPGDITWDMYLCFENVEMPDGVGSGYLLNIGNFYGELDISYGLKTSYITTAHKDEWLVEINAMLTAE